MTVVVNGDLYAFNEKNRERIDVTKYVGASNIANENGSIEKVTFHPYPKGRHSYAIASHKDQAIYLTGGLNFN